MSNASEYRYQVRAIADANCNRLRRETLLETDSLEAALQYARSYVGVYGAGILDSETGQIDFGHGFGVEIKISE